MKTALLAAVAAIVIATPAAAESGGYLGIEYVNGDVEFLGDDEFDGWQGEGAWGWRGGSWGAQIDGSFGNIEEDSGTDADIVSIDGHLYWDGRGWRIGGVVTHSEVDGGSAADETAFGIEGMIDAGERANFFGSLTFGEAEFILDADTWNLDVGANLYATPALRLGAFIGTGNVEFGTGIDVDSFSAGVNGEWRPWSAPVSLTAGWSFFEIDDSNLEANAFQVGARWSFGAETLQERNVATPFSAIGPLLSRVDGIW